METTITKDPCDQYYIATHNNSWATFTISLKGDMFIHTDSGYYCHNWRVFGDSFKQFIIELEPDYFLAKIKSYSALHEKKAMNKKQEEALVIFLKELQKELQAELKPIKV